MVGVGPEDIGGSDGALMLVEVEGPSSSKTPSAIRLISVWIDERRALKSAVSASRSSSSIASGERRVARESAADDEAGREPRSCDRGKKAEPRDAMSRPNPALMHLALTGTASLAEELDSA